MKEKIFGLQRNIFFLGLTSLFNDFSSEMIYAIFPAFITSALHAGAASLGLVNGVAEAASNFFNIYSGSLSDRFQKRKPLVVLGYTLSVCTRPFYLLVGGVGGVLGLRFTDRVGKGLRDAPRDAIISLSTPREELGRSFGYHRAMDTIGAILGPLVAFVILSYFPLRFDIVFVSAFVIGLCALMMLIFIRDVVMQNPPSPLHRGVDSRVHSSPPVKGDLGGGVFLFNALSPQFKWYLSSVFVLSLGSVPIAILLLKTESLGLVIADIPLFYMVYNISYAGFSYSAGKMSDRIGAHKAILIGYVFLIASYGVIAFAESSLVLVFGFLLMGFFPALTDGVQRSLAAQLTGEEVRGTGLGFLNAAVGFGALFAGVFGGFIWQVYGAGIACGIASAVIALGLALLAASERYTQGA